MSAAPELDELADAEGASPTIRRFGLYTGPALFLFFLFFPESWGGDLDPLGRRVLAVTALTATWWITAAIPIGAASLLPAALFPLLGVMSGREVAPRYMQDLLFLFLGAFVIALGLERWNVHRRMALWIISIVGTRPRSLVLGFMCASAFLSLWINNTSTTLLMLPIALAVIQSVSGKTPDARDPFAMSLLLGVAYSASMGGVATPVGTAPNQVFLGQFRERYPDAPDISFGAWLVAWGPLVLCFLPVGWFVLTRVALRVPNASGRGAAVIREERAALGPMSAPEKWMSGIFAATALLWVTRADLDLGFVKLPGWVRFVVPAGVDEPSKFVTDATVATCMALVCFVVPVDRARGVYLMDWKTAAKMPWEVLLLIGGGFAIAGAFKESGLDQDLGALIGPLLAGRSSWVMVLSVVLFMAALTEITSNTATTTVLLPVMGQAAVAAEVSPLLFMAPATIAASAAFMLPVATPPNAVVFSSRLVPPPTMARVGLWLNVTVALLLTLVFQLWVRRVFGIEAELPEWAAGGG